MIGGALEGNAYRDFSYSQLRIPTPVREDRERYPPRRATIVDRGTALDGSIKSRGFANLPGMLRILSKYNVSYDLVTDDEVCYVLMHYAH